MSFPRPIVCDNTIPSNFAAVEQLRLLPEVFSNRKIYTTLHVLDEIGAGVEAGYAYLAPLEVLLLEEEKSWVTLLSLATNELRLYRVRQNWHISLIQ